MLISIALSTGNHAARSRKLQLKKFKAQPSSQSLCLDIAQWLRFLGTSVARAKNRYGQWTKHPMSSRLNKDSSDGGTNSLASVKEFLTVKHIFQHSLILVMTLENNEEYEFLGKFEE